ncbi:Hypothetical protein BAMTRB_052 [Escherichia phage vB_Eco_Bam]|uniref:Uncharacterized protein n=1 Tax=Escherichia phage vB_Eco_Bam TaxID=2898833 RepID=A0A9P0Y7F7_9CAUD|nr:hypothetical protein TITUS_049 [Escherichia phage vB_Eco_Titus]CAI9888975.1 Hypothetical protein BAMTRB_052 [Escherichia phage vB_Eco_Bam]
MTLELSVYSMASIEGKHGNGATLRLQRQAVQVDSLLSHTNNRYLTTETRNTKIHHNETTTETPTNRS